MTEQPYQQVKEFHEAFNHPSSKQPQPLTKERLLDRHKWTGEELLEGFWAVAGGDVDEFNSLFDAYINGLDSAREDTIKKDADTSNTLLAQVDSLVDALYFIYGSFVEMGIDPKPLFDIVHGANMAKLVDGKPQYRESDGKIAKPDGWEENHKPEPRLEKEIERQKNQ